MSTSTSLERPALNELSESNESNDRPPLSILAVIAFVAGLLSLVAPFSFALLPLSFVAVGLGALVCWQLSGNRHVAGIRWAFTGLTLGVGSAVWCLTASLSTNNYLFELAGSNAKVYLELIGEGKIYEALELHVTKGQRQIAGTDLKAYYDSKTDESGEMILDIIDAPGTKAVEGIGPKASWSLLRGVDVRTVNIDSTQYVTVEMVNDLEPAVSAQVTLSRRFFVTPDGQRTAWWSIERMETGQAYIAPPAMPSPGVSTQLR